MRMTLGCLADAAVRRGLLCGRRGAQSGWRASARLRLQPGTDWETLAAEDADLRAAAEVVVGRSDLRELTALGMPRVDAAEVSLPESLAGRL